LHQAPTRSPISNPTIPHRRFRPGIGSPDSPTSPHSRSEFRLPTPRRLYADEPLTARRHLPTFLARYTHFALIVAAFFLYRLEGRGLQIVLGLACAALPIHYALPYFLKKPAFILLSITGIGLVFGADILLWVALLGTPLIALSYAPVRWSTRIALITSLAALYACARAGMLSLPIMPPGTAWPVLASLVMFRLILFLYELKHATKPEHPLESANYFLLLPNACFLHFPVVDFRALGRGYFSAPIHQSQREGLTMLTRGLVHLLAYRFVYHRLIIDPASVDSPARLAIYLVANYLLYLRVSGQFHTAIGLLHLFGYRLPETHHRFLLASSFTDYWRRINIYWKDFMVRTVFHPVAFALRRHSQPLALTAATLAVFLTTWLLHGYQSFWLRGTWTTSLPDALFWGILGLLVLVNVHLEALRPPRKSLKPIKPGLATRLIHPLKVAATFLTITLLWSLWSSPSIEAWLQLMTRGLTGVHSGSS
jgi:D-alanyl-lipoteichoic acid acyltransferase DltB (MBOAT superfamily)